MVTSPPPLLINTILVYRGRSGWAVTRQLHVEYSTEYHRYNNYYSILYTYAYAYAYVCETRLTYAHEYTASTESLLSLNEYREGTEYSVDTLHIICSRVISFVTITA